MKNSLYFLLLCGLFACDGTPPATETVTEEERIPTVEMAAETPDSLLRHAVLFSFKEESYPAGVTEVEQAFLGLPDKISEIHDFEWGTNNSPEGLDQGFTHCFFVTFRSEADRAAYLPHPAHQAFVEVLKPHLNEVLVLDYWAKK